MNEKIEEKKKLNPSMMRSTARMCNVFGWWIWMRVHISCGGELKRG